jgi:hypothetical protein
MTTGAIRRNYAVAQSYLTEGRDIALPVIALRWCSPRIRLGPVYFIRRAGRVAIPSLMRM